MDRAAIIGSPGSGKSTLATTMEQTVGLEHIELDALFHRPNWRPTPVPEFRAAVAQALEAGRWVVDGNYRPVQDLIHGSADTIIFIDLARWRVVLRVLRRSLWRVIRREQLWGTNHESLRRLVSSDPEKNIVIWTWVHHPRYRVMYQTSIDDGSWAHAEVHHLRSPSDVRRFRRGLAV